MIFYKDFFLRKKRLQIYTNVSMINWWYNIHVDKGPTILVKILNINNTRFNEQKKAGELMQCILIKWMIWDYPTSQAKFINYMLLHQFSILTI